MTQTSLPSSSTTLPNSKTTDSINAALIDSDNKTDLKLNLETLKEPALSKSSKSSTDTDFASNNSIKNEQTTLVSNTTVQSASSSSTSISNLYSINNIKYISISILAAILVYYLVTAHKSLAIIFTYVFGFTCGCLLCLGCLYIANKLNFIKFNLTVVSAKTDDNNNTINRQPTEIPMQLQSLLIQTPYIKENKNFDGVYKGWMNELREVYEPDNYFLNKTRSVYVNLDGVMLRLQTTTTRVPKRAVCGEHIGNVSFNELRVYDLSGKSLCLIKYECNVNKMSKVFQNQYTVFLFSFQA